MNGYHGAIGALLLDGLLLFDDIGAEQLANTLCAALLMRGAAAGVAAPRAALREALGQHFDAVVGEEAGATEATEADLAGVQAIFRELGAAVNDVDVAAIVRMCEAPGRARGGAALTRAELQAFAGRLVEGGDADADGDGESGDGDGDGDGGAAAPAALAGGGRGFARGLRQAFAQLDHTGEGRLTAYDLRATFLSLGVRTSGSTSAEFSRMLAAVKEGAAAAGGGEAAAGGEGTTGMPASTSGGGDLRVSQEELGQWLLQLE